MTSALEGRQLAAAINMLDVCNTGALGDVAEQFTCDEADSIAALMDAFGHDGERFLREHAYGDTDEGDRHRHLLDAERCDYCAKPLGACDFNGLRHE